MVNIIINENVRYIVHFLRIIHSACKENMFRFRTPVMRMARQYPSYLAKQSQPQPLFKVRWESTVAEVAPATPESTPAEVTKFSHYIHL